MGMTHNLCQKEYFKFPEEEYADGKCEKTFEEKEKNPCKPDSEVTAADKVCVVSTSTEYLSYCHLHKAIREHEETNKENEEKRGEARAWFESAIHGACDSGAQG